MSRERAREGLLERIRELRGDVTVERLPGEGSTAEQVAEAALTPSLFGGVRVFVLRHAQSVAKQEAAALAPLLRAPLSDEYVVIEAEQPDRTATAFAGLLKAAKKRAGEDPAACTVLTFEKPPPWKTAEWVGRNVPALFGRTISKADAEYLVDLAGDDFDTLRSELEKIDLALPPKAPVSRDAIAATVTATREAAAFEVADALGRRDTARALRALESMFAGTFYAPLLVNALFRRNPRPMPASYDTISTQEPA